MLNKEKVKLSRMTESPGLEEAAGVLRMLSHPERLKILCHLGVEGEMSVGELLEKIPLSASALSQHLAKLRQEELVATRKERQSVYYRVERPDVLKLLSTLHGLYCST